MSAPVSFAPSSARSAASDIERTACLNTSRPAIVMRLRALLEHIGADIGVVAPPAGRHSRSASVPSLRMYGGQDALSVLAALEDRGAGAIAEQHARRRGPSSR